MYFAKNIKFLRKRRGRTQDEIAVALGLKRSTLSGYENSVAEPGMEWKEISAGIAKVMQNYCGDTKTEELMKICLQSLDEIHDSEAQELYARNPHELMRALEALDILTCSEIITHACLARKASNRYLYFERLDYPDDDPPEWRKWVTLKLVDDQVKVGELPLDYAGSLEENYEAHKIE